MTDTPRTDAFWNSGGFNCGPNDDDAPDSRDMLIYAQLLERENARLREALEGLYEFTEGLASNREWDRHAMLRFLNEQARAALSETGN